MFWRHRPQNGPCYWRAITLPAGTAGLKEMATSIGQVWQLFWTRLVSHWLAPSVVLAKSDAILMHVKAT